MVTAVDGTHPTGMLSCLPIFFAGGCMLMKEIGPCGSLVPTPLAPQPLCQPLEDYSRSI